MFLVEVRAVPSDVAAAELSRTLRDTGPDAGGAEVLRAASREGLDNRAIAARARKSEKTVRNQVSTIFDKLGVRTRAEAIVKARQPQVQL